MIFPNRSQDIVLGRAGTAAATPAAARPAVRPPRAAAAATACPAAEPPAAVVRLARRRAHKGKVNLHGLVQQLGAVGAVDGRARLF
jgi:hypothetical protein